MARKIFCISTLANQSQKMTQIVQLSPEFKKVRNKILSIISVSYFRISGSITNDYILVETLDERGNCLYMRKCRLPRGLSLYRDYEINDGFVNIHVKDI